MITSSRSRPQTSHMVPKSEFAASGLETPLACCTIQEPVALAVRKAGRGSVGDGWPIVAAVTHFHGETEPVLKMCWKTQHGTSKAISLPRCVLTYAETSGVKFFFLRDDRRRLMWTCPLEAFNRGRLGRDGERYVPLERLELVPYRGWDYATTTIYLVDEPAVDDTRTERQLDLFGGA